MRGPGSEVTHLKQHETDSPYVVGDILFPRHRPKFQWQCSAASSPPPAPPHQANQLRPCAPHPVPSSTAAPHLRLHFFLSTSIPFPHIYVQEELRPRHPACRSPTNRALSPVTVSSRWPFLFRSHIITSPSPPIDMNDPFNPQHYFNNNVETI